MDVENLAKELILKNMTPEQQMAVLDSVRTSVAQAKEVQKRKIGENVDLVVQALKKIESDIRSRFDDVGNSIEKRVASIKDGRDGADGKDGRDGKDGKNGRDGLKGDKGDAGRDGRDGVDGVDGISVTNARIDFDGSLVIYLSNGVELNVGEVVAPDLAEHIKVITNGGGTSQSVLDTLASLQTQINNLIPSQTGNSGKFLTTNGTSTSWASVAGGLSYQGTWNASTNTPTLASSTGTNGYYYIVATAGSTNLDGITSWSIGDWLLFNGSTWQKIDQSETLQTVTSTDTSVTVTTTGTNADLAVYSSPRLISQVRNETGATLTKGTVVYINGASGNKATVTKAIATGDSTSAQTFGLILADISTNNNGYAILAGEISGLDTSAFANGTQLYLSSTTAGTYTSTKQYAPNHLVYIGVVTRSHVNQGSIEVRIQNGYEMDELHNVSAQNPTNGQVLIYNESTSLWEKNTLTDGTGISITEGAGSITIANSGVTSAVAGTGISVSGSTGAVTFTNSAPDQTVALTGAGTTSITGTYPNFTITSNDAYTGTVTSVGGTGTVNGISLSGTVTSSGSLTLGGTLSNVSLATQVTGTLPIANGGTGQTTANAAFNALVPSQTSNSGKYLTTDGTNTSWSTVASATPAGVSDQDNTSTGYFDLPSGTTAQRPVSPSNGMIRFNTTKNKYEIYSESSSSWLDINTTNTEPYNIDYLVIAGGGGGSSYGGGGAGGFRTGTAFSLTRGTTYTVTVGAGGAGGSDANGTKGVDSVFSTITSTGGGYGGNVSTGGDGGSGGGGYGGTTPGNAGGSGNTPSTSPSQGNNGGRGLTDNTTYTAGGGGGGAGAVGSNAASQTGGAGGSGTASSITGSSVTYAGGGGGRTNVGTSGAGGSGGGGQAYTSGTKGGNGTTNTGGGAGSGAGASGGGGTGGSGVVILSIPTVSYSGTTTGSPTVTTSGSNTILKFTGSGSYTA